MRPQTRHPVVNRLMRQIIVWVLVVSLPINSVSTMLTHLLGASHRHEQAQAQDASWHAKELLQAIIGQEAMALIDAHHVREHGLRMTAHVRDEVSAQHEAHQHGGKEHVHAHAHEMLERHFHEPSDGPVVVMGAKDSGHSAPGGPHSIDAGAHALLPLQAMVPTLVLTLSRSVWRSGGLCGWRSHVSVPLERPPRR